MAAHKAWRLNITDHNGVGYIVINEITHAGGTFGPTIFSNGDNSGWEDDNAFDQTNFTAWQSRFFAPFIIGTIYGTDADITFYKIKSAWYGGAGSAAPRAWTFEYSDDTTTGLDGTWTVADTQTNETGWGLNEERTYVVPVTTVTGDLDATEPASDIFEAVGPTPVTGDIAATEQQTDDFIAYPEIGARKAWRIGVLANNGHATETRLADVKLYRRSDKVLVNQSSTPGTYHTDAFNAEQVLNGGQYTGGVIFPFYVGKIFDTPVDIGGIAISRFHNADNQLKDWDLEWSDDTTDLIDGTWHLFDKVRNQSNWIYLEQRFYPPEFFISSGVLAGTESAADILFTPTYDILSVQPTIIKRKITCTFTGDTLPNQTIPISNLLETIRQFGISSANIFIPNRKKYAGIINQYVQDSGEFYIDYVSVLSDGNETIETSQSYKIDSISGSEGITINGTKNFTVSPIVKVVDLPVVTKLERNFKGSAGIETKLDRRLLPNDQVNYDNNSYVIRQITTNNYTNNQTMILRAEEI